MSYHRRQFYHLVVAPVPPVFLSCNLTNPVHLASIVAFGCDPKVVQIIADNMMPATRKRPDCLQAGVLVNGMYGEVLERLEDVFRGRFGGKYERKLEDVDIKTEDGCISIMPAYIYGRVEAS
jgi:hypothetical protein